MQNKHGLSKTRLHRIWRGMRSRCSNPNDVEYKWYGKKGIRVCEEWNDFMVFREWSLANGYSDELSIDRIDGKKGYSPDNCRWTTMKVQQNNRCNNHVIEYKGKIHTMSEWAEIIGIAPKTLSKRLCDGWDVEKALTTPLNKNKSNKRNAS